MASEGFPVWDGNLHNHMYDMFSRSRARPKFGSRLRSEFMNLQFRKMAR